MNRDALLDDSIETAKQAPVPHFRPMQLLYRRLLYTFFVALLLKVLLVITEFFEPTMSQSVTRQSIRLSPGY